MYDPSARPRNPVTVAELNDAQRLRGLASALDLNIDDLASAPARLSVMRAIRELNGTARKLSK